MSVEPMGLREMAGRLNHLGDATRLAIIVSLSEGEKNVGDLGEGIESRRAAVSHHLAILRHAGIVTGRREGQSIYYSLTECGKSLRAAAACIAGA